MFSKCREQCIGLAIDFKQNFRIPEYDINTNTDRCGTARHFNNKYCDPLKKQSNNEYCDPLNNKCNIENF